LGGLLTPSHGPGLFLAVTGGFVALAGGVAGLFWSTAPLAAPPARAVAPADETPTERFSKGRAA